MERGDRMKSALVAVLAAASLAPVTASASEVVSLQAQAVNGGWSLPSPGMRSAMCLVDSGVDPTQLDVPKDLRATTVAGITSTLPAIGPDSQPVLHGTWMTQVATAPIDGQGMIGSSPGVPLILVRAMRDGLGYFAGGDYSAGMLQCDRAARAAGWRLASIALALGGEGASAEERDSVAQRVENLPAVPVAAVGNRPGVPQFPAGAQGVVGITSVSAVTGEPCVGSADADAEAQGLVGPGCFVSMPIDGEAKTVKSSGTSGASVVVAAAIAQVCDLVPELTPRECLAVVQSTARAVPGGKLPNLRAAALSRGLVAPAVTAPLATLTPPGSSATPSTPVGGNEPGEFVPAPVAPRWFGEKRRPKIKLARGGRVTIVSPDKNKVAKIWTNLRGAKTGKRRTVTGRARGSKVKVRVTQVVGGRTYERTWTLKVPRRR